MSIKIVRCLWGKLDHQFFEKNLELYHRECILAKENDVKFKIENQTVIVWDEPNKELMGKLGYPYHYMGESKDFNAGFNFMHKLIALETAMNMYGEIIFLDWDCLAQKPLDDNFFNILRSGGEVQMPLYFYGGKVLGRVKSTDPTRDDGAKYFVDLINYITKISKLKFRDGFAIPNSGFIYCRDKEFFRKILDIQKTFGISTNIEEICSMIYFNEYIETLDSYLEKIEPCVCLGKDNDDMLGEQVYLNDYTIDKLTKNIYFIHE